jgi:hypothetical protein
MTKWYQMLFVFAFLSICITSIAFSQPANGENEYRLAAVNPRFTPSDTITADAGRGVWVVDDYDNNLDLDQDGKPEILVTEYSKGGRVFVYEVVGDDRIEFVWASKILNDSIPGGFSSPRMVTTGDFDNNGRQEIIFPIGYFYADSLEFANRGIYFFEWTGNDNDFGIEPAFKLTYEYIDSAFAQINVGIMESGIRCQDIDDDGRSELLFPPRVFNFDVAKLYIMQVSSGTFSGGDAIIDTEYVYTDMVFVPSLGGDGYVPCGTDIGDVDSDDFDEIIVAGWTNIGSGMGLGFIEISGPDTYTPGSIVPLKDINNVNFSGWVVKAKPLFAEVNGAPVIYLQGSSTGGVRQMWVVEGIFSDQFVTESNVYPLFPDLGYWSAWALGDQDHPTNDPGDGLNLYLYNGGARFVDVEYDNLGSVTDTNSYTITKVYDLSAVYDTLGGLFNDFYTYPGMDLDDDGLRDLVTSYKGWGEDSISGQPLAKNGFHVFMFEWGDSTQSIDLDSAYVGFKIKPFRVIAPDDYQLAQNYPNPFNPETTIDFTLPIKKAISLKIYNTLGQEVRTLINNQEYLEGPHSVKWDSKDNNGIPVASGIYVYKLIYGNFSQAKKMTLVR